MNPRMIEFSSYKPEKLGDGSKILRGRLIGNTKMAVGVDPGVNYGLTLIEGEDVFVFWGKLPSHKEAGLAGIEAYDYIKNHGYLWDIAEPGRAVVEGAAYDKRKGQVGLETVRFGFFLALHHLGYEVKIMAPSSIRLAAFGAGRTQGGDVYVKLNHNAADSVGCALAALELYND